MKSSYDQFSSIWAQHHVSLYKYLFSRIADQYDTEDVLQTTALKAARSFHQLKNPKDAKTWLFAIATNAMNDHFRRKDDDVSFEKLAGMISVESEDAYSDLKFSLVKYLKNLPAAKQNLFYLYMQKTLTVKEIAKVLDIGYSTARKWLAEMQEDLLTELYDDAQ